MSSAHQRGFSLVQVMIAAGLMAIVSAAFLTNISNVFKATKSASRIQDLDMLKMAIQDNISCSTTLRVNSATPLPIPCAGPYLLRDAKGRPLTDARGNVGEWRVRAICEAGELKVYVRATKKDPLLKKIPPARDLFNGVSELCRSYFSGTPCPAGEFHIGYAGGVPVCSRRTADACEWIGAGDAPPWSHPNAFGNPGDANLNCPLGSMAAGIHCGADCTDGFALLCCRW